MVLGIFKIAVSFERSACFYVTISGNFGRFQYINFETNKVENTFPCKTAMSGANGQTNRMVNT